MRTNWISKKLWVKTGLNHQKESGSASKHCPLHFIHPGLLSTFLDDMIYAGLLFPFWGFLFVVTQSLNTSSKQCDKEVLLNRRSLEYQGCLSCKHSVILVFFLEHVWVGSKTTQTIFKITIQPKYLSYCCPEVILVKSESWLKYGLWLCYDHNLFIYFSLIPSGMISNSSTHKG